MVFDEDMVMVGNLVRIGQQQHISTLVRFQDAIHRTGGKSLFSSSFSSPFSSPHRERSFSTSTSRSASYEDTVPNLKIGKDTRVVFQGFTGRQATQNAKQSLEYGTKIVGGVTPSRSGEHLGLPVLPSMRDVSHEGPPALGLQSLQVE